MSSNGGVTFGKGIGAVVGMINAIGDAAVATAEKVVAANATISASNNAVAPAGQQTTSGITDGKTTGDLGATSPNSLAGAIKGITPGGRT